MQGGASSITVVGGFQVEQELGRGGMARVYRVRDPRSGQRLALKKLLVSGDHGSTLKAMFEREYHSLVQLAHPHIVSVFDYGLEEDGPFYTMELLEGMDCHQAVQDDLLGIREACILLRDAASALALIHSRRMLHRDVSSRNLWCTPDGRGKLIDFGTLVAMGPQTRVAGTPPFVPPEALYAQPMDARSDLYGLGALAYSLLTKQHAFAARQLQDLRALWQRRPPKPRALRAEISEALSDLVMALLSFDPRGRPTSAAEVVERLSAIAQLPASDDQHLAQSYLTSPKLVGREAESRLLRARLSRAVSGRGSALAIVAAPGLGRSRMLASVVLDAKLLGAAVVGVDAGTLSSQPLALATAIAERLIEELPTAVDQAGEVARVLGHLSDSVHHLLGKPELSPLPAQQRNRVLSSAIIDLVEAATRHACVVLVVDDLQLADSASLTVLGRLSLTASGKRLLLLSSCDLGALAHAPPVLEQLTKAPNRLDLTPLNAERTHELLASLFGSSPGLDDAANWLHELSRGSPQACMQYAQYLVDQGIARYASGQWTLPARLRDQTLPRDVTAMLEGRLGKLSADARSLALGLALARDETRSQWQPEAHLEIEAFPALFDGDDPARSSRALDELLGAGIVEQRDSLYVLGQRAIVDALLRVTSEEARKAAHLRLAAIFDRDVGRGHAAAMQLLLAGEHGRARDKIVEFSVRLSNAAMDWGAMRVSVIADGAKAVLTHWQEQGGSPREGILLRRLLLMTCSVYDWGNATRYGGAQLAQLRSDCGLIHWEDTESAQPELQRVIECLKRAQATYDNTPEATRGFAPGDAVRELASTAMSIGAAFVHAHDFARARAVTDVLRPLHSLSPLLALLVDLGDQSVLLATGREPGNQFETLAQRLLAATQLPEVLRVGGAAVYLHRQAIEDARRGHARALDVIALLVPGAGDDMFLVLHGRWLAHAFLGESQLAERFRKRIEVITDDDVWRRKEFLFAEAQLHALAGNLLPLERAGDAIAELVPAFEGWRAWLAYARAESYRLRGELDAAAEQLRAGLCSAPAGEHRAWAVLAPAAAELMLQRGDAPTAVAEARAILRAVEAFSLDRSAAVAAERVLALAESRLDEHAAARASLGRAFALARELTYGGLPLAQLHEAAARVALAADDAPGCTAALGELRALLEHADAPSLVNAYEALCAENGTRSEIASLAPVGPIADTGLTQLSRMVTDLRSRLASFSAGDERARHALDVLLAETGTKGGHLFLFRAGELFLAASTGHGGASEELRQIAQQFVAADLDQSKTEAVTVARHSKRLGDNPLAAPLATSTRRFPVLLWDQTDRGEMLAGVALLETDDLPRAMPHADMVRAISRCLVAAGDSTAVSIGS